MSFTIGSSVTARTDADTTATAGGEGSMEDGGANTNPNYPQGVFPALFRRIISP
jgi:hypothetical protein